jgi:tight adherence protein C
MNEALGLVLLFLGGAGLVWLVLTPLWWPRPKPAPEDEVPEDPLAGALAAQLPAGPRGEQELLRLLWGAGYYHRTALTDYLAIRAVLCLAPLFGAGVMALGVDRVQIGITVLSGMVLSLLGFSIPRIALSSLVWRRALRIKRALPAGVDLLVLCLTAGQNLLASVEQASQELASTHRDLAQELRIVYQHARLHSLEYALTQWADRSQTPEVRSLVLLLVQSERLGTDTVSTLNEFAQNYRVSLRQRAEEQANRASFWMLFPTVFCLFIASAIILVGPAYLEFWRYRREQLSKLVGNARNQVARTDRSQAQQPPAENAPAGQGSTPRTVNIKANPAAPAVPAAPATQP